jgi:hypothetical protein
VESAERLRAQLKEETRPGSRVMKEPKCSWEKQWRRSKPNEEPAAAKSGVACPEEKQAQDR